MVWVPAVFGGEYSPDVVIVPAAGEPPTTPSTDQVTPLPPPSTVNCCARIGVSTATPGVIENPVPIPVSGTVCGVPCALSEIETAATRVPVALGVNVTVMVQL